MGLFSVPLDQPEFKLDPDFLLSFSAREPNWGPVGYVVYKRTYSRFQDPDRPGGAHRTVKPGESEEWWQTIARVVEGCYQIQQRHCAFNGVHWDEWKAQRSAQRMYELIFEFKFTPPGRGLWMMGTPYIRTHGSAALNNCAYVSTENIDTDFSEPFVFLMDMSMLGVGVGSDTRGAGIVKIGEPLRTTEGGHGDVIADSREGWIEAVKRTLDAYVGKARLPAKWNYSAIRPEGAPIRGFGGTAAGPEPLRRLLEVELPEILNPLIGKPITGAAIVDIFNVIGKCVVSGNVRRSAEILFGEPDDMEFLRLKDPEVAGERMVGENSWRWACVTGDTLVTTQHGMRPIESLVGREDLTTEVHGGRHAVGGVKQTGVKPVFEVRTAGGPTIKATTNHQFMTNEGWKRLDELEDGDRLVVAETAPGQVDTEAEDYQRGYLLGALIGDGSFTSTSTTGTPIARLLVHEGDEGSQSLIEYMEPIIHTLFDGRSDFDGFSGPHGVGRYHFVSRREFTAYAAEMGVVPGHKTVSDAILHNASRELQAGVLAGLFDADGWVIKDRKTWGLEQVDRSMLERVQQMLLRLGIPSRVGQVRAAGRRLFPQGRECDTQAVYRLVVAGYEAASRFVEVVAPRHARKLAEWQTVESPGFTRPFAGYAVTDVVACGEAPVYDANVPSVSAFAANGLHVHNSNNSVFATVGMDYSTCAEFTAKAGEPGYLWLDNIRDYGRMADAPDYKDQRAMGANPCVEQTLESYELCCLCETYPAHHDSFEEYEETLKYAYLYAKTVTLLPTHNPRTNRVMMRNRRIGLSQSGIIQNVAKLGWRTHFEWCDRGYHEVQRLDKVYSDWLAVPRSIKTTSVKPSGTVSKLSGATAGIHYPIAEHYILRIRFAKTSPMLKELEAAGYEVHDCVYNPATTRVVEFPVKEPHFYKPEDQVSMWEQLAAAAQMQKWWADNQVSCTIKFDGAHEGPQVASALALFDDQLKGISFLHHTHGYAQAPQEAISADEYARRIAQLEERRVAFAGKTHEATDAYCDGAVCEIPAK